MSQDAQHPVNQVRAILDKLPPPIAQRTAAWVCGQLNGMHKRPKEVIDETSAARLLDIRVAIQGYLAELPPDIRAELTEDLYEEHCLIPAGAMPDVEDTALPIEEPPEPPPRRPRRKKEDAGE